eukprot:CCRYP_002922-RA/>CCRYP_002922-RA protein AED:0.80 eAED:0.39 QI:0/0/0/0.5/1/1/2/0/295
MPQLPPAPPTPSQSSLPPHPTPPTATDASDTEHTEAASAVKLIATLPQNTTIAIVTVGRDNEANNRRGGRRWPARNNAATLGIRPTLASIARNLRPKPHPKTPEDRCFWNKRYKGYRGKWICGEMEIAYVPRHKFAADMGGYPSEAAVIGVLYHNTLQTHPTLQPYPALTNSPFHPNYPNPLPSPATSNTKPNAKLWSARHERLCLLNEATLLDHHISWAEGERTTKAKADTTSTQQTGYRHSPHNASQETPTNLPWTGAGNNHTPHPEQSIHHQTRPPPPTHKSGAPTQKPPHH